MFRLLVATVMFVLAANPAAASIVFPPEKHVATEETLTIILEAGDADAKVLTLVDSGVEKVRKDVAKGVNRIDVSLPPGMSSIKWGAISREVFLSRDGGPKVPEDFRTFVLHEAMDDCENCHESGPTGLLLKSEVPALCVECHDDPTKGEGGAEKTAVHSPVADGDCLDCHGAHSAPVAKLLLDEVPTLCVECHGNMAADAEGKEFAQPHDPVQSGDCLGCHLIHAADQKSLLKAEMPVLCNECHDDVTVDEAGAKKAVVHDPVGSGECTSCHAPHGGANKSLLIAPVEELCKECHDGILASDTGDFTVPHEPAAGYDCLACHEAHAATAKGLTKKEDADLCLECHDDPRKGKDDQPLPKMHEPVEDGCLACHRPHGSDAPKILAKAGSALCNECHDDVRVDERGFAFDYPHQPVDEEKCGDCHQVHGGANEKLLKNPGNKLCLECHTEVHDNHRDSTLEAQGVEVPFKWPVEKNGDFSCQGCHLPHGSDAEVLLTDRRDQMCIKCHTFSTNQEE